MTQTARHTPGRWKDHGLAGIRSDGYISKTPIARCYGKHRQSNALLIAAAPELLEALEELMEAWQANPDHYQDEIGKYGPLLAKAKGGAA